MTVRPLAIDLCCGLGGWTEGLLAEGYDVVGFDIEQHVYGEHRYPAQLVIQDVLTIHGKQFKSATLIVASPPCQAYSWRAMPWKAAKAAPPPDNSLFEACFRIQREACTAAGRHIPLIVENVRGAQKWVGRARWNFGSFYLWGDVPALMPVTARAVKVPGMGAGWRPPGHPDHKPGLAFNPAAQGRAVREERGVKFPGGFQGKRFDQRPEDPAAASHGNARKAASALIAKIPLPLSRHIARTFLPAGTPERRMTTQSRPFDFRPVRPGAPGPAIPGVVTYEFTFTGEGDFAATRLAEQFLRERGFAYGPAQGPDPRAIMFGDYLVAKWRNLTRADKAANHGVMLGRPRTGPIMVVVYSTAPAAAIAAMKAAPTFFEGATS